jgi:hypothetical protein
MRAESREARADGQVDEDLDVMCRVLAIGPDAWSAMREHARARNLLQPYDDAALRAACCESGRPPNEVQARRLVVLLERARETGWDLPELEAAI